MQDRLYAEARRSDEMLLRVTNYFDKSRQNLSPIHWNTFIDILDVEDAFREKFARGGKRWGKDVGTKKQEALKKTMEGAMMMSTGRSGCTGTSTRERRTKSRSAIKMGQTLKVGRWTSKSKRICLER